MRTISRGLAMATAALLMTGGFALAQNTPVGNTGRFERTSDCTGIADPTQRADCARATGPMNSEPFKDRGGRAARGTDGAKSDHGKGSDSGKGSAMTGSSGGSRGGSGASHSSGGGGRGGGSGGHGGGSSGGGHGGGGGGGGHGGGGGGGSGNK
jgi:hypothetical protein